MPTIIALDLETSSTDVATCHVREIGMAVFNVAETDAQFLTFSRTVRLPPGATEEAEAQGIHKIPPTEGASAADVAAHASLWLAQFDKVEWLGHNVGSFDVPILYRFLRETGCQPIRASYRFRDTASLALALKDAGIIPQTAHSLGDLCEWAGIERPPHRAGPDAVAEMRLYRHMVRLIRSPVDGGDARR